MLGAPQSRAADAAFAPPSLDPPPLDLNLRIGALDLGAGQTARRASARLRMDRGRLDLDDVAMDLGGARAAGRLTLRRDAALAAVTGQASVEPVAVDQPALRGRIGGELTFAGSGDSLGALIGGLAGEGKIELRGAVDAASRSRRADARVGAGAVRRHRHRRDQCRLRPRPGARPRRAAAAGRRGAGDAQRRRHPRRAAGDQPRRRLGDGERRFRSARAEPRARRRFRRGARRQVLDWPAARSRCFADRRACRAGAAHRRFGARRGPGSAGDRARHRSHLGARSRHPRAGLVQPPPQGGAVHAPARGGTRGLCGRAGAAEGGGRAQAGRRRAQKAEEDRKRAADDAAAKERSRTRRREAPNPPDRRRIRGRRANRPTPRQPRPAASPPTPAPRPKAEAVDPTATGFY